jgi:Cu/Ag efflux protein CusF
MRSLKILAIAIAAALPLASVAQKQPEVSGAVATAPGKAKAVAAVTANATVDKIDAATRTVTLKLPSGDTRTVVAGDEVRNFDQIKVGDKLKVKYVEALTLELKKDGKAVVGRTETGALDRSKPGDKPGGVARREITVVADVINVDEKAKKVTVKGAKGQMDLNIRDPEQLKLIKKGDKVEAIYTQALAISMTAAPAAAPKKEAAPKK